MDKDSQLILRKWLDKKFEEKGHGVKVKLAAYLGISSAMVGRMTKPTKEGYRAIRGDELIKMGEFFGELPPGLSAEEIYAERSELINLYEQATPEQQQIILSLLKSFAPPKKKK